MIDFEEELKKFQPSLEVEDAEEAINTQNQEIDMATVLYRIMEEKSKKEERYAGLFKSS